MVNNPYLSGEPQGNPYLQADSKIVENLSRLVSESTTPAASQGGYRSALETLDLNESPAWQGSSEDKPMDECSSLGESTSRAYRSPDEVLQEEATRQQQEQARSRSGAARSRQEAIRQEHLERARTRQLESQARAFLKKLDTLDPLNSDRMWFESFAKSCASRLEAAMEFIETVGS